jgi:hypothetical protein
MVIAADIGFFGSVFLVVAQGGFFGSDFHFYDIRRLNRN